MKKVLFTLAAVLIMSAVASAQVPNPISLYVGGAISVPTSPEAFSDVYKTGFHGSVGAGYKLAPNFQVVGKMEYHRFAVDWGTADASGGNNNMWMFGADGRYAIGLPAAPVKPYVLGGLGFARISTSDIESTDPLITSLNDYMPEAQTKLYFNIGGGVELKSGPMFSLFGQIRYVSVATEGDASAFIPITLGVKFF